MAGIAEGGPAEGRAVPEGSGAPGGEGTGSGAIPTPTLAEIYVAQGMPEKALEVYRQVLEGDPENEEVLSRVKALSRSLAPPDEVMQRKIAALRGWLERIRRARDVQDHSRGGGRPPAGM